MAFNLNGFNFNPVGAQFLRAGDETHWADCDSTAPTRFPQGDAERNATNFPLDLALSESRPVA